MRLTARASTFVVATFVITTAIAQPATRPAGLEPGEAEAKDRAAVLPLPKEWSHPSREIRGIWLASRDMLVPDAELLKKLDTIKSAGLNTVLIDTYFKGFVAYPGSTLIPQAPDFRNRADVIALLVSESHQRGLRADLWMEYGYYAYFTPDAAKDKSMGPIRDKNPE